MKQHTNNSDYLVVSETFKSKYSLLQTTTKESLVLPTRVITSPPCSAFLVESRHTHQNLNPSAGSLHVLFLRGEKKEMSGLDVEGKPVCEPLGSLEDVINWDACNLIPCQQPLALNDENTYCSKRHLHNRERPKVLVCHDMKGGYLDDRFTQGCDNPSAYRFYHWNLIDTFIYFSHHFITIPPLGWICAAHTNGVEILGTIITEWHDGAVICKKLLANKETIELVSAKLADIAFILGFDGWLINIENVIEDKSIPHLRYFVDQLSQQCHKRLKNAKVLWYDSVTSSGHLDWQNELNTKNEMFFSVCDGIFLNYAITEDKIVRSRKFAETGHRHFDVYVGVDVFGRATPGGGGFNCQEVISMISKNRMSCALFAQGWVYETHGVDSFDGNERKFWGLLKDYLPVRCIELPLSTSFCQGYGQKHYLEGMVISDKPWHNLSLQQLQPNYSATSSLTTSDAYNGGGCLKLTSLTTGIGLSSMRLFRISLHKEPLTLSVVWKNHDGPQEHSCDLAFVLLSDTESAESKPLFEKPIVLIHKSYEANDKGLQRQLLDDISSKIGAVTESAEFVVGIHSDGTNNFGWKKSKWNVDWSSKDKSNHCHVMLYAVLISQRNTSYGAACQSQPQRDESILLGNIQMQWKKETKQAPLPQTSIANVVCLEINATGPLEKWNTSTAIQHLNTMIKSSNTATVKSSALSISSVLDKGEENHQACCIFNRYQLENSSVKEMPYCLHLLDWRGYPDNRVDFYVVFSRDENGLENFIGCTRTTSLVNVVNKGNTSPKVSMLKGYTIQAVWNLNHEIPMCHKFIFSIS